MYTGKEGGIHYFAKSVCFYFSKYNLVFNVDESILLITNKAINKCLNKEEFLYNLFRVYAFTVKKKKRHF